LLQFSKSACLNVPQNEVNSRFGDLSNVTLLRHLVRYQPIRHTSKSSTL